MHVSVCSRVHGCVCVCVPVQDMCLRVYCVECECTGLLERCVSACINEVRTYCRVQNSTRPVAVFFEMAAQMSACAALLDS